MKNRYTDKLVKTIINKVMNATYNWIIKETIIVDTQTGKPIQNAHLALPKENKGKLTKYVNESLGEIGIIIEIKNKL